MARLLNQFIQQELQKPFEWSKTDCCSTCNRWVKEATGISPISQYKYSTEEEAKKILSKPGGIAVLTNKVMRPWFKKTKEPKLGDIGLVIWNQKIFPAIKIKEGWFSRSEEGLILAPDFWKAWDICHKH